MVHVAMEAAQESGIDAKVIDLRTLLALDLERVAELVNRTGRAVVVQESTSTSGFGAELAALNKSECCYQLEAPV